MFRNNPPGVARLHFGVCLAAIPLIAGCAHVKPDEMAAELDQVRQEIRERDQAVENRVGERIDALEARLSAVERSLQTLQDEFQVTVDRLESAVRFNAPIHFEFDDSTVRSRDHAVLDRFAQVIRGYYSDALITVEGFTDSAGSVEYNRQLGHARAEAVKEYLTTSGGLPESQLRAVSYGEQEDRQVALGSRGPGDEGWENRRVAMVIDFRPMARSGDVAAER